MQSSSTKHLVGHTSPEHWYAPQLFGTAGKQEPEPLQIGAGSSMPEAQEPVPHVCSEPGKPQTAAPEQVAAHWPWPPHAARPPRGNSPSSVVHVPSEPGTSHAWHCESQVVSQQKPSAQMPFEHWPFAPHGAPWATCGSHTPPEQKLPLGQSASATQSPAQVDVPHAKGAQGWN
jgi:hypothetical protein